MKDRLGRWGESFVAEWLERQGLTIVGRNLVVPGGELDVVARDRHEKVVVEVRTITGPDDPLDAVDHVKRQHVQRLAGAARCDFVGVGVRDWGVEIHWLPG